MSKSIYTENVKLPSCGLLNPEIPNGEVTIRCITIADQKFLSGASMSGNSMVQALLRRCVESPENFDPSKLTGVDTFFLLVKLRVLSYGGNYSFITKCPECGRKTEVDLDLSKLMVDYLEEDYADSMNVVLPHSGDKVYTKIIKNIDEEEIDKEVKRIVKKFKDAGDPEITIRLSRCIDKVELKDPNDAGDKVLDDVISIQKYVEGLTDLDATAISSTLSVPYGIQTTYDTRCKECREDIEVGIKFTSQFFRPKYDGSAR